VHGVSLREIRLAAGVRNNSALQFHFGDRDGLLLAFSHRHLPRIEAIQKQLYARLVAEGRHTDMAALVEVLVRPNAEYLRRGPSERAWIKVSAEQMGRPDLTYQDVVDHAPAIGLHVGAALHDQLAQRIDPTLAVERMLSVLSACHHLCADRARIEDDAPDPAVPHIRPVLPFDTWLANLLDMAVGALLAPARD
jgi:hypothetical protein